MTIVSEFAAKGITRHFRRTPIGPSKQDYREKKINAHSVGTFTKPVRALFCFYSVLEITISILATDMSSHDAVNSFAAYLVSHTTTLKKANIQS